MGNYGWSMDFGTSQDIVAVEYGRVLEYPKKRNKISDHEKARSREQQQKIIWEFWIFPFFLTPVSDSQE